MGGELKDPLGRTLVLAERTRFGHILRAHPELMEEREFVESAVVDPREIRISRRSSDVSLYHGSCSHIDLWMRVLADVELGVVKTAHYVRQLEGGQIEWCT